MAKTSAPAKATRTKVPRLPKAVAASVRAARDKKAFDVVVLDLRKVPLADHLPALVVAPLLTRWL